LVSYSTFGQIAQLPYEILCSKLQNNILVYVNSPYININSHSLSQQNALISQI